MPFATADLPALHDLLTLGYSLGGGRVATFEEWKAALLGDSDFDPALVFVVSDAQGAIVAVCQCWASAFVKDLVVHPSARRQGLGEALLHHVFAAFTARGADIVDLKVEIDNPTGARRLYERVGMKEVA
ncbi:MULTISPECIES: GNAT family N-acetyltransferase [unclassified Bosea (in: a-proteobacteria)]|uniref:GNAT family N-acetyltransferase n=1 Tax=unclassified Bosea (in: a-proteobacteria) TaxID=2653178 RepID=UPI001F467295|nr:MULTISPECIES: GNAT family N-acetyltransferase [unclassified Bosea (in: a-proteobacteria)]